MSSLLWRLPRRAVPSRISWLRRNLERARTSVGAIGLWLMVALAPLDALAGPVTFSYAGTITQVPALDPGSPFPDTVEFGTLFNGTYTFDTDAPNTNSNDYSGTYRSPLGTLTLNLGGLSFAFTDMSIGIVDSPGFDFYSVVFAMNPTDENPTGVLLSLSLAGLLDTALSTYALPLTPPSLALFDTTNAFFFTDTIDGNQIEVGGSLDELKRVVPEPSLPVLPVIGAASLATWLHRRRTKSLSLTAGVSSTNQGSRDD